MPPRYRMSDVVRILIALALFVPGAAKAGASAPPEDEKQVAALIFPQLDIETLKGRGPGVLPIMARLYERSDEEHRTTLGSRVVIEGGMVNRPLSLQSNCPTRVSGPVVAVEGTPFDIEPPGPQDCRSVVAKSGIDDAGHGGPSAAFRSIRLQGNSTIVVNEIAATDRRDARHDKNAGEVIFK